MRKWIMSGFEPMPATSFERTTVQGFEVTEFLSGGNVSTTRPIWGPFNQAIFVILSVAKAVYSDLWAISLQAVEFFSLVAV